MNSNDKPKVELNYVTFQFDWHWIKDKTIIHKGTKTQGMLAVLDEDGVPVKMWGYELISNTNSD